MTGGAGESEIARMLDQRHLQRVTADAAAGRRLVEDARRHLKSAALIKGSDPNAAFSLVYDAARKACSGLLLAHGLRATSRGGHVAVRDAVLARFGTDSGGEVLRSYDRLRRRRHDIEYPDRVTSADAAEVEEGLRRAEAIVRFARRVIQSLSSA